MVLQNTIREERAARLERFRAALKERILVLDCAMGTMIQSYGLSEGEYRGVRFADRPGEIKGNNDLLSLTQPGIIRDIQDRKSTRLNSSHANISYAVFCLKKNTP